MRIMFWLIAVLGLLAALGSCGDDGEGKVSRYCSAMCEWYDECTDWFDDEWDDHAECERECKEDVFDGTLGDVCRAETLDFNTCQYEYAAAENCDMSGVMDVCDDEHDALQDCLEQHQQNGPDDPQ